MDNHSYSVSVKVIPYQVWVKKDLIRTELKTYIVFASNLKQLVFRKIKKRTADIPLVDRSLRNMAFL